MEGTMLWRIKVSLLEEGYKTFSPFNSVKKYADFAANNLWQHNKWSSVIYRTVSRSLGMLISIDSCNIIGMYMTGVKPRWKFSFFHKDAPYFENDDDLIVAMNSSDEFAFTSRLTSGVSFDHERFDVITSYFSPLANTPRSGAQQLLRARSISTKNGFFAVSKDYNRCGMKKPVGYLQNKNLCLSRESFSLNLLNDWGLEQKTLRVHTPGEYRPLYFHLCNERAIAARPYLYTKMLKYYNDESGYESKSLGCYEICIKLTQRLYNLVGKEVANLIAAMSGCLPPYISPRSVN